MRTFYATFTLFLKCYSNTKAFLFHTFKISNMKYFMFHEKIACKSLDFTLLSSFLFRANSLYSLSCTRRKLCSSVKVCEMKNLKDSKLSPHPRLSTTRNLLNAVDKLKWFFGTKNKSLTFINPKINILINTNGFALFQLLKQNQKFIPDLFENFLFFSHLK